MIPKSMKNWIGRIYVKFVILIINIEYLIVLGISKSKLKIISKQRYAYILVEEGLDKNRPTSLAAVFKYQS